MCSTHKWHRLPYGNRYIHFPVRTAHGSIDLFCTLCEFYRSTMRPLYSSAPLPKWDCWLKQHECSVSSLIHFVAYGVSTRVAPDPFASVSSQLFLLLASTGVNSLLLFVCVEILATTLRSSRKSEINPEGSWGPDLLSASASAAACSPLALAVVSRGFGCM